MRDAITEAMAVGFMLARRLGDEATDTISLAASFTLGQRLAKAGEIEDDGPALMAATPADWRALRDFANAQIRRIDRGGMSLG